jgi:oxygen-independent coproporphyrinogen-3 oxidase
MAGQLPSGDPVPPDGGLPPSALTTVGARGFGVYVHVPFCLTRCGYCDFNTYAPGEGASRDGYVDALLAEIALAARVLDPAPRAVDTVFFGGGTPTLLPVADLVRILDGIERAWGLAPGAEVSTEANPESVDPVSLRALHAGGFTRISLGMQSAAAGRVPIAATEAREAGFDHVNLDLIYGTPGETADDFAAALAAATAAGVDHVSAYALIVEDGTRLAARMRRGELPYPSDDVAAERYLAAEAALGGAGLGWYEVSNWAASDAARCAHNMAYWTGGDWWGLGPGAHSHVGGVRWWNVKHPTGYAARLTGGVSPGAGREVLTDVERHTEDVMLRLRLRDGLPLSHLDDHGRAAAARALGDRLLEGDAFRAGTAQLTLHGRLLADAVVRDLLP